MTDPLAGSAPPEGHAPTEDGEQPDVETSPLESASSGSAGTAPPESESVSVARVDGPPTTARRDLPPAADDDALDAAPQPDEVAEPTSDDAPTSDDVSPVTAVPVRPSGESPFPVRPTASPEHAPPTEVLPTTEGPTPQSTPPAPGGVREVEGPPAAAPVPSRRDHSSPRRGATGPVTRRRQVATRVVLVVLALLLVGTGTATVHLWRTTDAWERRAGDYRQTADELGTELAATRAELDGTRAELEAVRGQLSNANTRIAELANEKAQIGDDREAQRQLVDYQERVTEAAGDVALALDQCVQGQQQLITYLGAQAAAAAGEEPYEQTELDRYAGDVDALCDAATEANNTLQSELER